MFKRLAAFVLVFTPSSLFAVQAPPPEPLEVGIVCGPTEFYAHNFSTSTQVLVFHSGDFYTWRVLAPGTWFSSKYSREMLDGVTLEIANYDAGIWRTSRSFNLADLCDSGADALWIRNTVSINSWLEVAQALSPITPGPSMLPVTMPVTAEEAQYQAAPEFEPMHTPVVTPTGSGTSEDSPVVNERPLPPI